MKKPKSGCFFGHKTLFNNHHTAIIVHGFMTDSNVFWMNDMADVLVKNHNYDVILVDWNGGDQSWKYWRAVASTQIVGRSLAK